MRCEDGCQDCDRDVCEECGNKERGILPRVSEERQSLIEEWDKLYKGWKPLRNIESGDRPWQFILRFEAFLKGKEFEEPEGTVY